MNSEAVSALLAKNPALKASKSKLEAMKAGAYVVHRSWGFGQIKSFDDTTLRLVIDFKGKKAHAMDPAFCVTTMEVLPANHLLVRKETEPKKILELIAENPAQLIVEALESYPNKATTAIDLEITLSQVIGEEKFKKWWADARKAVAKDPRVHDKLPAVVGTDAKFFPFPSVNGSKPVLEAAGDFSVQFGTNPAATAFLQYLAGADAAKALVSYKGSGFISANKKLDTSAYTDDTTKQLAEQVVSVGDNFRFDMSDLAPAAFGGTPNKGEWADLQTFLGNGDIAAAQKQLEADAVAAGPWSS